MDALGAIKPVVPQPVAARAPQVLPSIPSVPALPSIGGGAEQVGFDAQGVETKHTETLIRAAQSVPQPLGSQTFTMFKDVTGQMVTRYRDQNSGKVTYIPEPQLLRLARMTSGAESLVNIKV